MPFVLVFLICFGLMLVLFCLGLATLECYKSLKSLGPDWGKIPVRKED